MADETFTFYLPRTTKKGLRKMNLVLNANDRFSRFQRMEVTKKLRQLARYHVKGLERGGVSQYTETNPARVILTVYPPTNQKVDPPNLYPTFKALLDGLTDAGVWSDDNNDVILETAFRYGGASGKKGHYRLDIRVMPCASLF